MPPNLGTVLNNRYWVEFKIAAGTFGSVYRAHDQRERRPVAIKMLNSALTESRDAMVRFEREARMVNQLRHDHIVRVLDFGSMRAGPAFYVMELLTGQSLEERLGRRRMTPAQIAAVLGPVCAALDAAHRVGVVHRVIKASNVFLHSQRESGDERVVLLDFGIAKLIEGPEQAERLAAVGMTPFVAPEQRDSGEVGPHTDIYGLALLTLHMLTGKMPVPPKWHKRVSNTLPQRATELLLRALDDNPAVRPPSAAAFFDELKPCLAD